MLRNFMGGRHAGMQAFAPEAWAEYLRVARNPDAIHAMCEDYRAAATIDLEHDSEDQRSGNVLRCPLKVLWGAFSGLSKCLDPLDHWKNYAISLEGKVLPCGHYIAEERPELLAQEVFAFFTD